MPTYNEQEVVAEFHARLSKDLDSLDLNSEVIFVNDGSSDETRHVLSRLQDGDSRTGIVDLSRNFGKEAALTAGIEHACGDAVIVIDADLQDPPELIPEFIRIWREEKVDVIYGQRTSREGESWLRKATAHVFYKILTHAGKIRIPRDTGDFRLMDRRAVDALKQLPERHRFMKGLFTWIGFNQRAFPYVRERRHAGKTHWNYWRLWNLAIEGFTGFSVAPLQIATYLGSLISFGAFLLGAFIVFRTLIRGDAVPGWPSLMVTILFLGGIQLLFIGIIGEYLARVFNETKGRPLYLVESYLPSAAALARSAREMSSPPKEGDPDSPAPDQRAVPDP